MMISRLPETGELNVRILAFTGAVLFASVATADAQRIPANCRGMFTATLASGRPHGDLKSCGPELVPLVTQALRAAHRRSDTLYVAGLVSFGSDLRHPEVLEAAVTLAEDRSAPRVARMGGLLILASQHEHRLAPRGAYNSIGILLSQAVPLTCQWEGSVEPYTVDEQLPAHLLNRIQSTARALQGAGEDPAVRNFATCLLRYADALSPALPPPGAITVENKCETVFVIRNASAVRTTIRWAVDGSSDPGGTFDVGAHQEVTFQAFDEGTLRVYHGSEQIGSAVSTRVDCPRE